MRELEHKLSVYVIAGPWPRRQRSAVDIVRAALQAGVRAVQLRDKESSDEDLLWAAGLLRDMTRQADVIFIVNDRPDVALAVGADGAHVGPDDMSVYEARRFMGLTALIGASVETVEEAVAAEADGASYLGVGPVFATASKADAGGPVGCRRITEIKNAVNTPVIAVGGIGLPQAREAITAGADGVAVVSAVADANDMALAAQRLLATVEEARLDPACQR